MGMPVDVRLMSSIERRGPLHKRRRPSNNGLHQTGRGGVAPRSQRPVVEARPAGEPGCWADIGGGTET
jgi:hypothetical protein